MVEHDFVLTTPVVYIIFNRPDCVRQSFARIRQAKPQELFIIADGPRADHSADEKLCAECRRIVEDIDWDCIVHRNYSDTNLGCGRRPATGFDWVFEKVENAIILEDDCVPSLSFFRFCQEMLIRYRDDERIYSVSGMNWGYVPPGDADYFFTHYHNSWGWATWRRVWEKYDYDMKDLPLCKEKRTIKRAVLSDEFITYWHKCFDMVYEGRLTTAWDYQFMFLSLCNDGLHIFPRTNMVTYIGFTEQATHVTEMPEDDRMYWSTRIAEEMSFPIRHPAAICAEYATDFSIMEEVFLTPPIDERIKSVISQHEGIIRNCRHLFIYGAGQIGRMVIHALSDLKIDKFNIAVTKNEQPQYVMGNEVRSIDEYIAMRDNAMVLIAVAQQHQTEIIANLKRLGFSNYMVVL